MYQASVCTSGSLNGVLHGSHYNRSWFVHNTISEALERMLFTRFIAEMNMEIPHVLREIATDPLIFSYSIIDTYGEEFMQTYDIYFRSVLDGKIGKIGKTYLEMMRMQTMAHAAVQENNFEMHMQAWAYWIPLYFATNMFSYARYGSYYLEMLKNIDQMFPGLKELMKKSVLSVQGQERYPHRTAVDQHGEQTINRDAKTSGKFIL